MKPQLFVHEIFRSFADGAKEGRNKNASALDVLKGALREHSAAKPPRAQTQQKATRSLDVPERFRRPASDKRTAQQIIDDNPTLRNLGQDEREALNDKLGGDYTQDTDRAYAASKIIEEIERFNAKGEKIGSGDDGKSIAGNGKLDGYRRNRPPLRTDSEARRFDAFKKDGFGALAGNVSKEPKPSMLDKFKKPEDDHRSAKQIIDDSPLLKNLGQNARDTLKSQLGDYENDPAKAYAASVVVAHIERFDEDGKVIKKSKGEKNDPFNDRIDGYTKSGEAKHGTEAGRLQDFGKYGFDVLKGDDGNREPQKEGKEAGEFVKEGQRDAFQDVIDATPIGEEALDIVKHPEKYTSEQRLSVKLELELVAELIRTKPDLYARWTKSGSEQDGDKSDVRIDAGQISGNAQDMLDHIQRAIDKVDSPQVQEMQSDRGTKALQETFQKDPGRKAEAERQLEAMIGKGQGLNEYIKKAKGNVIEGTREYLQIVSTLNMALGKDGKPLHEIVQLNVEADPELKKKLADSFVEDFQDPQTLRKLVDSGKTEQEALDEMSSRAALFAMTGAPEGAVSDAMSQNTKEFMLDGIHSPEDLNNSGFVKDGKFDEEGLTKALDEVRKKDPDAFKDPNHPDDEGLTNGQIVAAARGSFDAFRNYSKTQVAANKAGMSFGQYLKTNPILQKSFGSGAMHAVSGLLAAGIGIARGTGGDLSPVMLASTLASGIQAFGIFTQSFEFTQRGNPQRIEKLWGSGSRPSADIALQTPEERAQSQAQTQRALNRAKDRMTNIMNFGKVANGAGGMAAGATGIALGVEALKKGDKALAAVYLTQGISNTLTGAGPLVEALRTRGAALMRSPLTAAQIGRMFTLIGAGSMVLNVAAALAPVIYEIVDQAKNGDETKAFEKAVRPILDKYDITGDPSEVK